MKTNRLKAGFTIEASVVVPIAMVLIAAVMMVSFALHDRVIMRTAALFEIMDHAKGFEEEPEEAAAKVEELLAKRLTTAKDARVVVEKEKEGTTASVAGNVLIPGGLLRSAVGTFPEEVSAKIRISNLDGRKVLIGYKTICDGISALGSKKDETGE